jgi:hypothetical protein
MATAKEPLKREDWPEDFWKAFEGMSPDFERPPQVPQKRASERSHRSRPPTPRRKELRPTFGARTCGA